MEYDLSLRALFNCCRMISSQLGVEFSNKANDPIKYGGIKKVYSIFICPNAAQKRAGVIEEYKIVRNVLSGPNLESPRYDIMRALIVYARPQIGKLTKKKSNNRPISMLEDLFDSTMDKEEKLMKLQNEYSIKTTYEVEKEVSEMTGALKMFEEQWVEKGRLEGIEKGRLEGEEIRGKKNAIAMLKNGKLSYQDISKYSGLSLDEVRALKDELSMKV